MRSNAPEIQVVVPRVLRAAWEPKTSAAPRLRLFASSVGELLAELQRQYPQVHARLCDEQGQPRPHINVFVNDQHVRARAGLLTPLTTGDLVTILPAVSGG